MCGTAERGELVAQVVHPLTLECKRCGDLVDWVRAKQRAYGAKRTFFRNGDGCGGVRCTRGPRGRPTEHARTQCAMAAKLRTGARVLVEWPTSTRDKTVWQRPDAAAQRKATGIADKYGATGGANADDGEAHE